MRQYQDFTHDTLVELAILGRLYHFSQYDGTHQAVIRKVVPLFTRSSKNLKTITLEASTSLGDVEISLDNNSSSDATWTLSALGRDYDAIITALYQKGRPAAYEASRALNCALITSFAATLVFATFFFAGILSAQIPLLNLPINLTAGCLSFLACIGSVGRYHYNQNATNATISPHFDAFTENLKRIHLGTNGTNPKGSQKPDDFVNETYTRVILKT